MPRQPHVLFFVEEFPGHAEAFGGVRVSVRYQAEELAKTVRLTVLAPRRILLPLARYEGERARRKAEAASRGQEDARSGIRVLRPPYFHVPVLWPVTEPLQLLVVGLATILARAGSARLFHGHRAYPMGMLAVLLGRLLRRKVVVTAYGSDVHQDAVRGSWMLRRLTRFAFKGADRVVAVSHSLLSLLGSIGVPEERRRYVPSGVDLERFLPLDGRTLRPALDLPADAFVFLCSSEFLPVKGHAVLVEAFALLVRRHRHVLLVLTGGGPLEGEIETLVRARGAAAGVRFAGIVSYDNVPRWVAASDALVLPSLNEGMPLTILEAFACGKPVVASRVGGVPELVRDGDDGILVPPGDPEALAAGLERALNRSWNPGALRERSLAFAWPRVADRLQKVYREIAP